MKTLLQMARYNSWANQRVFETCAAVSIDQLSEEAKGTYGTLADTLTHLVEVEDVYLLMLQGKNPKEFSDDGEYLSHDISWFAQRSTEVGDRYRAMLEAQDEQWLESSFVVPWFGFALTRRDGLLQTWLHSAQHRAQILSTLGALGIDVPDVDYIFMLSLDQPSS
jgi:uncharacterized damage-inducible protein DinB